MDEEKRKRHEKALNEMKAALRHIQQALDVTTCALCIRDLVLAEVILQHLIQVIETVLEEENKEKKGKDLEME